MEASKQARNKETQRKKERTCFEGRKKNERMNGTEIEWKKNVFDEERIEEAKRTHKERFEACKQDERKRDTQKRILEGRKKNTQKKEKSYQMIYVCRKETKKKKANKQRRLTEEEN